MTQEEKARAYDEALERARKAYNAILPENRGARKIIEDAFPELSESEDERIRKKLIETIGYFRSRGIDQQLCEEFLAWLEKQKEPKLLNNEKYQTVPVEILDRLYASERELQEIKQKGSNKEFHIPSYMGMAHYNPVPIKQKEQKDELVYRLNELMQDYIKEGKDDEEKEHRLKCYKLFWDALEDTNFFEKKEQKHPNGCFTCDEYKKGYEAGRLNGFTAGYNKAMKEQKPKNILTNDDSLQTAYLKGQTDVIEDPETYGLQKEQKSVEWSKEDEKIINEACDSINEYAKSIKELHFTKSLELFRLCEKLKDLHSPFKPNKEQMDALLWCVAHLGGADRRVLAELYEHLNMYCK